MPGRQITNNIVIAEEVIHSMRSKRKGKGIMAIKIHLEKAYDRLSWDFLKETVLDLGLSLPFICIFMECVTSCNMRILWNGVSTIDFTTPRGFLQGDLISL